MIARPLRVLFDTNTLVSAGIRLGSTPAQALRKGLRNDILLYSEETWSEFTDVLSRPKFDRYRAEDLRREFIYALKKLMVPVENVVEVRVCRHPPDDKFLGLALGGEADVIVTGDNDLLVLHPFGGIAILTPAAYLAFAADTLKS